MRQILGIRFSEYGQVMTCRCDLPEDSPRFLPASGVMVLTEQGICFGRVVWQRAASSCHGLPRAEGDCGFPRLSEKAALLAAKVWRRFTKRRR
jgi:hypothetical protein